KRRMRRGGPVPGTGPALRLFRPVTDEPVAEGLVIDEPMPEGPVSDEPVLDERWPMRMPVHAHLCPSAFG
ncbi:hypothetical protein, partial [Streptomyces rochei]|uniref:hypothetical protein n=1 Tax=Streptomyces rochei TaxID=1928 RepID=UPI00367C68F8